MINLRGRSSDVKPEELVRSNLPEDRSAVEPIPDIEAFIHEEGERVSGLALFGAAVPIVQPRAGRTFLRAGRQVAAGYHNIWKLAATTWGGYEEPAPYDYTALVEVAREDRSARREARDLTNWLRWVVSQDREARRLLEQVAVWASDSGDWLMAMRRTRLIGLEISLLGRVWGRWNGVPKEEWGLVKIEFNDDKGGASHVL